MGGVYGRGERLPGTREIGDRFEVSPDTVARALEVLEAERLVYRGSARHDGWWVSMRVPRPKG